MNTQQRDAAAVVLAIILIILALTFCAPQARAHSWYSGMKNSNGWSCCGGNDCAHLEDGDVSEVQGGYYVASRQLFVPYSKTQASPDGLYHLCIVPRREAVDNSPRCFFAPAPSY